MKCPVDSETLIMTERNGVEIDYCPKCRGVWLDRGELDKVIERAAEAIPPRRDQPHREDQRRYGDDDRPHGQHGRRKKKESFLSDLFDFS